MQIKGTGVNLVSDGGQCMVKGRCGDGGVGWGGRGGHGV